MANAEREKKLAGLEALLWHHSKERSILEDKMANLEDDIDKLKETEEPEPAADEVSCTCNGLDPIFFVPRGKIAALINEARKKQVAEEAEEEEPPNPKPLTELTVWRGPFYVKGGSWYI